MKARFKRIITTFLISILLLTGLPGGARAAEAAVPNQTLVNVTAAQIKKSGASKAIQAALDKAKKNATADKPYVIRVAPGSYGLTATLALYSNTTLDLTGVTLKKTKAMQILRTGRFAETDHVLNSKAVTGYYYKNITVTGGILDAAKKASSIFSGGHAKNVTFENVTFQNSYNTHMIEVGAINGYTMRGCIFKNQTGTAEKMQSESDEAVQLDVLQDYHLSGFRPEDLAMKNVLFEDCIFSNFIRGIGSHTAILNNNLTNITIRNCYFNNGRSAAITAFAWNHAVIENNIITDVPRGIAVIAAAERGRGTYLSTTLATEGFTTARSSVKYDAATSTLKDVTIQNNTIKLSDEIDPMGIQSAGIIVVGQKITSSPRFTGTGQDNSGGLPAGDYYYKDITIANNYFSGPGNGIRVSNVKTGQITGNTLYCQWDPDDSTNLHGIIASEASSKIQIASNFVDHADTLGIYVTESAAPKIIDNTVRAAGKHGICGYNSKITYISRNTIDGPALEGINLNGCSAITQIAKNYITDPGEYGIDLIGTVADTITANTIRSPWLGACYIRMDSVIESIKDNMIDVTAGIDAITLYNCAVTDVTGNHIYGGQSGIRAKVKDGSLAVENVIDNCTYGTTYGVWVSGGTVDTVTGNYAVGADKALKVNGSGEVLYEDNNLAGEEIPDYIPSHIITQGAKAASCTAEGYTGDQYDLVAGTVVTAGETIAPVYHSEIIVSIKHPTTAAEGKDQFICLRCGKAHNVITDSAVLAAPAIRSAAARSGSVTVKWTHVPGATKYRLYRSVNGGSYKALKTTAGITFTDKTIAAGKTYKYIVKAFDGTVWSGKSAAKTVKP